MNIQQGTVFGRDLIIGVAAVCVFGGLNVSAQQTNELAQQSSVETQQTDVLVQQSNVTVDTVIEEESSGSEFQHSEYVTINVTDANIAEVLKAYSLQTGQSIVVGPEVVSENVNVRLNNIPWKDALDVILKPYGFGYSVVGKTIVINKLESMIAVAEIEPLVSRVFNLKYVDAYDLKEVCEAQLSSRGKISILDNKGLPGWEFGTSSQGSDSGSSSSQTSLGTMAREDSNDIEKSKVLIITDVPSSVSQIERVITELDKAPKQVLIEARFIEIGTDDLLDFGLDFATGDGGLSTEGVDAANDGENQWGVEQNDSFVSNPTAFSSDVLDSAYSSGLQLLFSHIGGEDFEMMLHMMEEDGVANTLSAPRVLTQNNQEAAILVGEKFPIIEETESSSSDTTRYTTSLDYYENVGIQLNVIPQVCDDDHINMIVHPVVSSIKSMVSTSSDNEYPRLKVREAQTQIFMKSKDTVALGGLQSEVEQESVYKVPVLGDIPLLGRLFRRETTSSEKMDLMILIKATIVETQSYASLSAQQQETRMDQMEMTLNLDEEESDASASTAQSDTVAVE